MLVARPLRGICVRPIRSGNPCQPDLYRPLSRRYIAVRPTLPGVNRQGLVRNTKSRPTSVSHSSSARNTRWSSTKPRPSPDPTPNLGSPANQSLSQRLKALSKEYGWTAMGVYLALSVLDFPFCYLAVQLLGPERVGKAEHAIIDGVRSVVRSVFPDLMHSQSDVEKARRDATESAKGNKATLGTQLVLAYAVHKSLIFFRIPLTAAVLPKVVKTLRSYGWNVGKSSSKALSSNATAASKS